MVTQHAVKEDETPLAAMRRAFQDEVDAPWVAYEAFDLPAVQEQIRVHGYAIVNGLVPVQTLEAIRDFWLNRFAALSRRGARVTWAPYLGQGNTIGFSKDGFQCLYRSCDFLWNEPYDLGTRQVCTRLNGLRNLILGLKPLHGITFSSDRYGIFVTTSYYPPHEGWLKVHTDGVASDVALLHHIVPLTIKGADYAEGGLVVIDRDGREVDVDAQMPLGSVLFYDGALQHGVRRIAPFPDRPRGRLQMFAIPTTFVNAELNPQVVGRIAARTFARAKWLRVKNRALMLLGFDQIIR